LPQLVPEATTTPRVIADGFAIAVALCAVGVWAHWLRNNPPYIPFPMEAPSGWNWHRPGLLIVWLVVAGAYCVNIAKIYGIV